MQKIDTQWVAKYWDFVEDFGGSFDAVSATPEQAIYFREIAAAFLRLTFSTPPGCFIEVIEAQYIGPFPVIAVGWNTEETPHGVREFICQLNVALTEFIKSGDWERLASIQPAHSS